MRSNQSFAEPVRLVSSDRILEIRNPEEAYRTLNGEWPDTRAKWYYAAVRACSSAMEGRTGVHVARRIFVEAARESRLHS